MIIALSYCVLSIRVCVCEVRGISVSSNQKKKRKKKKMMMMKELLANGHRSIRTGSSSAVSSATGNLFVEDRVPETGKGPSFLYQSKKSELDGVRPSEM